MKEGELGYGDEFKILAKCSNRWAKVDFTATNVPIVNYSDAKASSFLSLAPILPEQTNGIVFYGSENYQVWWSSEISVLASQATDILLREADFECNSKSSVHPNYQW